MVQQINEELLAACIEASSLFDNYPETCECIGTYEILHNAINNALLAKEKQQ